MGNGVTCKSDVVPVRTAKKKSDSFVSLDMLHGLIKICERTGRQNGEAGYTHRA